MAHRKVGKATLGAFLGNQNSIAHSLSLPICRAKTWDVPNFLIPISLWVFLTDITHSVCHLSSSLGHSIPIICQSHENLNLLSIDMKKYSGKCFDSSIWLKKSSSVSGIPPLMLQRKILQIFDLQPPGEWMDILCHKINKIFVHISTKALSMLKSPSWLGLSGTSLKKISDVNQHFCICHLIFGWSAAKDTAGKSELIFLMQITDPAT